MPHENNNGLKQSLKKEASEINKMYQSVSNNSRWLVESRVWFYRALGEALYEHRDHVLAAGYLWQEWAIENFKCRILGCYWI